MILWTSQTPTNHPTTLRIYGALQKFLVKKSRWGISTYQTSGGLSSLAPLHNSTGAPLPTGYEEHHGVQRKRGEKGQAVEESLLLKLRGWLLVKKTSSKMVEPGLWKHRKLPVVMELLGSFFEILTIFSRPCVFWSIDAPHYSLPICPGWYWMWEPRWTSRSRCIRKSSHKPRKTPGNSHFEPKNGGLEDDFSFSNSWFSGSMLICEGVAFNDSTFEFLKKHFFQPM